MVKAFACVSFEAKMGIFTEKINQVILFDRRFVP